MAQKEIPIILASIALISGGLLIVKIAQSPLREWLTSPDVLSSLISSLTPPKGPDPTPSPSLVPIPPEMTAAPLPRKATPTAKPSALKTPSPKAVATPNPQKVCYRFTVRHLDGSSSTLCYSQADFNELSNLDDDLFAAEKFYEFYLQGADTYQKQYEKTGSSIYLDAKNTQLKYAEETKAQIGAISLQMYNIEKRGY